MKDLAKVHGSSVANPSSQFTSGVKTSRMWLLLAICACEVSAAALLYFRGLGETVGALAWIGAMLLFISPILIVVCIFAYRRGRFGISFLLLTMGSAAVFSAFLLPTLIHERWSRILVGRLTALGVDTSSESRLDEHLSKMAINTSSHSSATRRDTPTWVVPLVRGISSKRMEDIQSIELSNDEQINAILEMSDRLSKLREVDIDCTIVSEPALLALANGLPNVEMLLLHGAEPPHRFLRRFQRVKHLLIFVDNQTTEISPDDARHIASIPGLMTLCIGYCKIQDNAIRILASAPELKRLDLIRTSLRTGSPTIGVNETVEIVVHP